VIWILQIYRAIYAYTVISGVGPTPIDRIVTVLLQTHQQHTGERNLQTEFSTQQMPRSAIARKRSLTRAAETHMVLSLNNKQKWERTYSRIA
jgi:hypothetical protein